VVHYSTPLRRSLGNEGPTGRRPGAAVVFRNEGKPKVRDRKNPNQRCNRMVKATPDGKKSSEGHRQLRSGGSQPQGRQNTIPRARSQGQPRPKELGGSRRVTDLAIGLVPEEPTGKVAEAKAKAEELKEPKAKTKKDQVAEPTIVLRVSGNRGTKGLIPEAAEVLRDQSKPEIKVRKDPSQRCNRYGGRHALMVKVIRGPQATEVWWESTVRKTKHHPESQKPRATKAEGTQRVPKGNRPSNRAGARGADRESRQSESKGGKTEGTKGENQEGPSGQAKGESHSPVG
jgi:hypothetical protein